MQIGIHRVHRTYILLFAKIPHDTKQTVKSSIGSSMCIRYIKAANKIEYIDRYTREMNQISADEHG